MISGKSVYIRALFRICIDIHNVRGARLAHKFVRWIVPSPLEFVQWCKRAQSCKIRALLICWFTISNTYSARMYTYFPTYSEREKKIYREFLHRGYFYWISIQCDHYALGRDVWLHVRLPAPLHVCIWALCPGAHVRLHACTPIVFIRGRGGISEDGIMSVIKWL